MPQNNTLRQVSLDFSQQSAARKWNSFIIRSMRPLPKTTCWIAVLLALAVTCGCDRGSSTDMVGKSAPDFTVQDSDRTVSLHELHGKVIVLNFWATWCPPCVQEMPSLNRLHRQLAPQGVTVLGVSVDDDATAYDRFLRAQGIHFPTYRDPSKKIALKYGTSMYPETYIIGRNGRIARKIIGPQNWDSPELVAYLQSLPRSQ